MASDRNQNTQLDQFKQILEQQSKSQFELRAMEQKLRDQETTTYVDKIEQLVKEGSVHLWVF